MAVGQNQWYHFGDHPFWDVHSGYGILTHGRIRSFGPLPFPIDQAQGCTKFFARGGVLSFRAAMLAEGDLVAWDVAEALVLKLTLERSKSPENDSP